MHFPIVDALRRFVVALRLGLILAVVLAAGGGPALAQTTSGNAGTGGTLWSNNGCGGGGCHAFNSGGNGNPGGNQLNAANASGVLSHAISSNYGSAMGSQSGLTATDRNNLAAYIATFVTALPLQTVTYVTAKNIVVTDPVLGTGTFTGLQQGGTSATKGSVSFSGSTITYTPGTGKTGGDTFTYIASGPGGTSSERTVSVNILTPSAPTVTSAGTANGTGGSAFSYSILAGPGPTGYGVSGALPPGVTLDPVSGVISGTPTQSGSFPVTISATNPGGTGTKSLTIAIAPSTPVISSSANASGTGGQSFSYSIAASYFPTSYGISSGALPSGVTLDPVTGIISGTPTQSGSFSVVVTAGNGVGTGSKAVTITIGLVTPVVTSATTAGGNGGQNFSYQIAASNLPSSFSVTGTLPSGVTVNPGTGLISGIPTQTGSFPVTISAANSAGTGSQSLTLTIALVAPSITSAGTASGTGGQSFSYQILAGNLPTSYGVVGTLPAGVTLNPSSGLISGTPTQTGSFPVTISASNGAGTGSQSLTLTIGLVAPSITSAGTASGTGGQSFSYQILAGNLPTSYGVVGTLPAGVTLNPSSGLISGIPTQTGSFPVTISASNGAGTGSQSLTLTIGLVAPVITSSASAVGSTGVSFSHQIVAGNLPAGYGVTGALPAGVTLNPTSGLIAGIPTQSGSFPVTISATNGAGSGSQSLTITISLVAPVISSAATASGTGGQSFSYQIAANNSPTSYGVTGTLPNGVTLNTGTGLIAGTPTQSGSFPLTISASNGAGTSTQPLTISIGLVTPVITSAATASGTGGQPFSYQIVASNLPGSYSVTGALPAGVTVNTATGLISGTPTQTGIFPVTLGAANGSGTGSQSLTITVGLVAPVITSAATASAIGGQSFSYQITAGNLPTSYSIVGTLPSGVTVNPATGLVAGTPTQAGSFPVSVRASNGAGTGSQSLTITVSLATPTITSGTSASGTGGQPFSYQIVAGNLPTTYGVSGTLPNGVTLNPSTGLIAGTPTQTGSFLVVVSAGNGAGSGTQALTIGISLAAPVVTSATAANGTGGQAFSYQITANNLPTGFAVAGALPGGITLNSATGLLSGTPTQSGSFPVSVSASNGAGSGSQSLTITIGLATPVITSAATASGNTGSAFSYQIAAANLPSSYSIVGTLPSGLSLDGTTGLLSGTPAAGAGGSYALTLRATNGAGTGTQALNLTINFAAPVVAARSVTAASGVALAIDLSAAITGSAASIAVATGPAHGTATVSGTVVTYTATAPYIGSDSFTYTATSPAPGAVTSAPATVSINVVAQSTVVRPATLAVTLNTPATLDLAPFITGTLVSGVAVVGNPAHGSVSTSGTRVTYTPQNNYFGADSFTYKAIGAGGSSATATVSVTVSGRPDPRQQAAVAANLRAQLDSSKRFVGAQAANFQQHMEFLHRQRSVGTGEGSRFSQEAGLTLPASSPDNLAVTPRSAPLVNNTWQASGTRAAPGGAGAGQGAAGLVGMPVAVDSGDRFGPIPADVNGKAAQAQNLAMGLSALGINGVGPGSVNLNALSVGSGQGGMPGGLALWVAGTVRFGARNGDSSLSNFITDGVTVGADLPVSDRLILGLGVSYARDRTKLDDEGSRSHMDGSALAFYGSYQMTPTTYIDGVLGYGALNYVGKRFVSAANDFAESRRRGDQVFASVSGGYEYRADGFLVAPYSRLDLSYSRLAAATETGAGANALHYGEQTAQTAQLSFGIRAEAVHQASFGLILPHARLEYQRGLENQGSTQIRYADQIGGSYALGAVVSNRNSVVLGLGSDFVLRDGLKLGVDYQTLRSIGGENSQAISLRLTKELGDPGSRGQGVSYSAFLIPSLGISVDAGYTFDDNVSRGTGGDKLGDESFTVNLRKSWNVQMTDNTRFVLNTFFGGEKFHHYLGLSHLSLGGQAEYQYRPSGDFLSPTLGVFARVAGENYQSNLRDGYRWSSGVTVRQPVTDRIRLFGAVASNTRNATSTVFDTRDYSARLNLDYQWSNRSTVYLTGEVRLGDVVSSGRASLQNLDTAKVFAGDDVFPQLFDYRFKGRSTLSTLGYSLRLGPTDALDFSWRQVQTVPTWEPGYVTGHTRYIDNQFSFSFLTRY